MKGPTKQTTTARAALSALAPARDRPRKPAPAKPTGGINLPPGQDDSGWVMPPPVALGDGSLLQLHKDGQGLQAAHTAIASARSLVAMELYILADDDTGRAFSDLLCAKARAGVRVRIVYDSFGCRGLFGAESPVLRRLREAGAIVYQFHPMRPWECQFSWRPANRDHRKLLLVDDDFAWLGGLNVANEYAASWIAPTPAPAPAPTPANAAAAPPVGAAHPLRAALSGGAYWRDNAISIRGPAAARFRRAFSHLWTYVQHGGRIAQAGFQEDLFQGEIGMLASVPTTNSPLRPAVVRLLRWARQSVLMTMAYFAPDDGLIDELCRAARRGVHVRLMLPGQSDVPAMRFAAQSFYDKLMSQGVEIYERDGVVLHAKTIVVDGKLSVVGSANLDRRSIQYNCELSAIIRSEPFGRQMQRLFECDVRCAQRIDPAAWRRRPVRDRLIPWAISRARYML